MAHTHTHTPTTHPPPTQHTHTLNKCPFPPPYRCSCNKGSTKGVHNAGGYGETEGIPGQHHASLDRRDATLPRHPGLVSEHTIVYIYMYLSVTSLTSKQATVKATLAVQVFLIAGLEYGMERWNGKWNGTVNS